MSAKFTPGPWAIWDGCSYRRIGSVSTGKEVAAPTVARDGHPDMYFPNGGQDGPDARLIVAAPDLYGELKKMVRAYVRLLEDGRDRILDLGGQCDPVDQMEREDPHLREARAALKKAGGSMSTKDDGGLAFPCVISPSEVAEGMSLRDYFAAHAPAEYLGAITEQVQKAGDTETHATYIMALAAYMYADAMLKARGQP